MNEVPHSLTWDPPRAAHELLALETNLNSSVVPTSNRLGVLAYVPPKHAGFPDAFIKNLNENKPRHRLILLSHADCGADNRVPCPDLLLGSHGRLPVINLIFLMSFATAVREGLTHFIYLESDCRVLGADWDERIFDQFFAPGDEFIAGGHLASMFRQPGGPGWKQFQHLVSQINDRDQRGQILNRPLILHIRQHDSAPFIFLNGAFSVIDVAAFQRLLCPLRLIDAARTWGPWDAALGVRVCQHFGIDRAFDLLKHLPIISSTSGDDHYPYYERLRMLDGTHVVGIHQVKTNWCPARTASTRPS